MSESNFSISDHYTSPASETPIVENSSILTSTRTETADPGNQLYEVFADQLRQSEAAENQLKIIENYESKKFLDEMREIQKTGKKAADLMLKASKNFAKEAEVPLTTSTEITETSEEYTTEKFTSEKITEKISESSKFDLSSSGTITSKISPRSDTVVGTETVRTYTAPTVESKTEIVSGTETETDKISESIIESEKR